jgi:hypothetical protein
MAGIAVSNTTEGMDALVVGLLCVVQVAVSATSWSLVQRSPTARCVHMFVRACMFVCARVCLRVCVLCVRAHVCARACACVCMCFRVRGVCECVCACVRAWDREILKPQQWSILRSSWPVAPQKIKCKSSLKFRGKSEPTYCKFLTDCMFR